MKVFHRHAVAARTAAQPGPRAAKQKKVDTFSAKYAQTRAAVRQKLHLPAPQKNPNQAATFDGVGAASGAAVGGLACLACICSPVIAVVGLLCLPCIGCCVGSAALE